MNMVNKIKCHYKKLHKQKEIYHKEHIIRKKTSKYLSFGVVKFTKYVKYQNYHLHQACLLKKLSNIN